ncbi:MFS transporter [Geodermatophilus sp. SYSU D00766]
MADAVAGPPAPGATRSRFPWVVFALAFALLLSDFMCRQVLAAVFPHLKADWALTDTQLGSLTSVVALTVAVLTVPLSVLGDRFGRRRAIVAMAALWSLATAASALAADYGQLLATRVLVGVGEAAYGSVGLAVVLSLFPASRRATLSGAFTAGASFGAVLGIAAGGALADRFGWRWAVAAMAVLGLVLVVLFAVLVTEERLGRHAQPDAADGTPGGDRRAPLSAVLTPPAVLCAYLGNGLQLFVAGSLLAWLPSYLNRSYDLPAGTAAGLAAGLLLLVGVGMIGCGVLTDRLARARPPRRWTSAAGYALASLVLLGAGFALPAGPVQLVLLGAGAFFAAGTSGPSGALVAGLTPASVRASALGVLAMANNLLGLAAGPLVTGALADRLGLPAALGLVPAVSLAAAAVLLLGRRGAAARRVSAGGAGPAPRPTSPRRR